MFINDREVAIEERNNIAHFLAKPFLESGNTKCVTNILIGENSDMEDDLP